jgi:N-methylhydantoinase A
MGPQSAGAKPGPACYDLGGELPTCTDADLILGYLNKDYFAGGKILLDYDKALKAIEEHVAEKLNLSVPEAAAGMYSVINVNMASGVREVSVKRGYDPREFPLVVAGGAGPIHSCMIALELEIPIMIVPRESSIFCAAGMLMSDLKHDFVRTYSTPITELDMSKLKSIFDEMRQEGSQMLSSENISDDKVEFHYSLDMRYIKQYHEVNVNIGEAELDASKLNDVLNRFHKEHDKLYGYSLEAENAPVELINARLTCLGRTDKPKFMKEQYASEDASNAVKAQRKVYLPDIKDFEQVDIFDGAKLQFGNKIVGPALIEQVNTTTFVAREYNLICDGYGSYTMYLKHLDDKVVRRVVE